MRCAVTDCCADLSCWSISSASAAHEFFAYVLPVSLPCSQHGNLPLHYAVMNQAKEIVVNTAKEVVIKAVLDAHPDGAKEKGQVYWNF